MKAIEINGKPKVYSSIPGKWKHEGQNSYNYDKADPSLHYVHGWRDYVIPEIDSRMQKIGEIYFDELNDNFTNRIVGLTPEELESRRTGFEVQDLLSIIDTLEPFEKVILRQAGFMEVLNEHALHEAYIILFNLSPSGNLKTVKDNQMMPILLPYQTEPK